MNIDAISSEKIKEKNNTQTTQNENEEKTSFSEEYQTLLAQNAMFSNQNIGLNELGILTNTTQNSTFLTNISALHSAFNYDTLTISKDDAMFFNDLVEKTDYIVKENGNANTFQTNLLKLTNETNTQNTTLTEVIL